MSIATHAIEELKLDNDTDAEDMLAVDASNAYCINSVLVQHGETVVTRFAAESETETTVGFIEAIGIGHKAVEQGLDVAVDEHDGKGLLHILDYGN